MSSARAVIRALTSWFPIFVTLPKIVLRSRATSSPERRFGDVTAIVGIGYALPADGCLKSWPWGVHARPLCQTILDNRFRRGAGVVELAALEMLCTGNRTVGSNPTLSARFDIAADGN